MISKRIDVGEFMDNTIIADPTISINRQTQLQRELDRWIPLLVEHLAPEKIILFGSMLGERIHEWSDVDLVVIRKTELPFLKRVREALLLLQPEVGVDIIIYTPEEFAQLRRERRFVQEEIIKKGEVLYERG